MLNAKNPTPKPDRQGISPKTPGKVSAALFFVALLCVTPPAWPQQTDYATLDQIKNEAQEHSQASDTLFYLADLYGPRLTGSPNYLAAAEWAIKTLRAYGLENVHKEPLGQIYLAPGLEWSGRSWSYTRCSVRLLEPQQAQLYAVPAGWSRPTGARISGEAIFAPLPQNPGQVDLFINRFRGRLKGKILLTSERARVQRQSPPETFRYSDQDLAKLALPDETSPEPRGEELASRPGTSQPDAELERALEGWNRLLDFLHDEQVLALAQPAGGQGGTLFTTNQFGPPDPHHDPPPTISISAEQYNRLIRFTEKQLPVKLEIEVESQFYQHPDHFNVIGDIPGTSRKEQVVMIGAHLDSWFGGTGATDNAAGVAIVMETMRILSKLRLKMNRTVRLALWDAEELNAAGSRAYIAQHYLDGKTAANKKLSDALSVYLNVDNGAGRIRGVYLQNNKAAVPVFESWLSPLKELGATTVSIRDSEGSDHQAFDHAGIPAFEVIQDPLNYYSRTHHSTMDLVDYVPPNDLKQGAAVLAAIVYQAANSPELVPRKR